VITTNKWTIIVISTHLAVYKLLSLFPVMLRLYFIMSSRSLNPVIYTPFFDVCGHFCDPVIFTTKYSFLGRTYVVFNVIRVAIINVILLYWNKLAQTVVVVFGLYRLRKIYFLLNYGIGDSCISQWLHSSWIYIKY